MVVVVAGGVDSGGRRRMLIDETRGESDVSVSQAGITEARRAFDVNLHPPCSNPCP